MSENERNSNQQAVVGQLGDAKEELVMSTAAPSNSSTSEAENTQSRAPAVKNVRGPLELEAEASAGMPLESRVRPGINARPACFANTPQEVAFVIQATIATATTSFFQGVSSIVTASIGRDLGMTQGEIAWISASSVLTAGAFQLGLGQLADLLGRKMIFIIGMGSFSAFTLLIAFAQNPFWMDVVSGILGISSAMVVPPAIGIMGAAYDRPSKRKNLAFSAFSAGNPLGFVFGSIMCGIATKLFNWRAAFIFLAILWAGFTLLAFWTIPKVEAYDSAIPFRTRIRTFFKNFDLVGTTLTIFGCGLLTASITQGPADGWTSPHVLVMLILGVLLLVAFGFWERIYAHPLMPLQIWKDRNFTFVILTTLPGNMGFMSAQFWLSLLMQDLQRLSALEVALHLLPQALAGLIWNIVAGSTLHRINNTLLLALAAGSYIASNVLYSLMRPDSSYWAFVFPGLILSVVGADFSFNVANMYVMQSLPSNQQALAGGIFNSLFRLGNAIALGLSTAVYTSVAATEAGQADPMLPYQRAFQVSIGLCAGALLFLPFVKLGTQGHATHDATSSFESKRGREGIATELRPVTAPGLAGNKKK